MSNECPKCGTPARVALVERAVVRCQIEADGSLGRALSLRGEKRVIGYECGGGHSWALNEEAKGEHSLVGKRVSSVDMNVWQDQRGVRSNPVIRFTDGSAVRFEVEECETGEYGVKPVHVKNRRR